MGSDTTVVIATRDRRASLLRTLDKLAELTPPPPIIVVDNASGDGTAGAVLDWQRARRHSLRLVQLPDNAGATARNVGVRLASTPYVAFSDDDSWWAPGALSVAERVMAAHPDVGLLAGRTVVGPWEHLDPISELMADSPLGRRPELPGPSVLGFLACAAVVRRSAYLEAGGFHPLLHFAGEEALLSYDLAARGWALCYLDGLLAHHHPQSRRNDARRRHRMLRNEVLTAWLRRPPGVAIRATAALARHTIRDPAATAELLGALRRLPAALARRRCLPDTVEQQIRILERAG